MNIEGAVEVVFDSSIILGNIFELAGTEAGDASRNAFENLKDRPDHILRISKAITKECENRLIKKGWPSYWILKMLFAPLDLKRKIKRCEYKQEDIELKVSVPKDDRPVAETAVAVKAKRRGLTVCLVTKNTRHFQSEEMWRHHEIKVLTPEEYIDP